MMPKCYPETFLNIDINEYSKTIELLYNFFKDELLNKIFFNSKEVMFRMYPPEGKDKEEAFYHLTHTDYKGETDDRYLDIERSKRLNLLKPIIQNVNICPTCIETDCGQILLWKEPFKKTIRYYLYLQDKQYIVILEERQTFYLVISAFYVYPEQEDKFLKRFEENKIDYL